MTTSAITIDHRNERLQQNRNLIDTVVLVASMTVLTAAAAYLILGWPGLLAAVLGVGLLAFAAPSIPPRYVMRLYRAKPMDRRNGREFYVILNELAARAGMRSLPSLGCATSAAKAPRSTSVNRTSKGREKSRNVLTTRSRRRTSLERTSISGIRLPS